MPFDADDLRALLPPLDPAPGPELAGGGIADAGCTIGELDLTSADLRGATVSSVQVTGWAPALAAELRIAVG